MYADDHQLYVKENSVKGVEQKLNEGGKKYPGGIMITFWNAIMTSTK